MIYLVPNADAKIKSLIFEDSVRSFYYCVCEHYASGHVNPFITNMQTLVTKLGIMVAMVSNEPAMSYCRQAIIFLCAKVLDNPSLIDTFDEIGLNEKGNRDKHGIPKNVTIDMLRCVTAYNNLVNQIVYRYKLKSLKYMIVRKSKKTKGERDLRPRKSRPKPPAPTASNNDGKIILSAYLERGDGRYVKGLFRKKEMMNFKLKVSIKNEGGLRITKAVAQLKGRKTLEKKLPIAAQSVTEFDLPTDDFGGHIEACVLVVYKIGIFKTKQIKVTVSKNF